MGRPSIFSKEYEKKMKKRKKMIFIGVIIITFCSGVFLFIGMENTKNIKNSVTKIFQREDKELAKTAIEPEKEVVKTAEEGEQKKKEEPENKYFEVKMSQGEAVKVFYEESSGVKKISTVSGKDYSNFDINPSQSQIIFVDGNTQDLKLIDVNGTEKLLTKPFYITKSGQKYTKEAILSQFTNMIWSAQAKFIDDTHIAYISNLPYFRSGVLDQYVWIVDITTAEHKPLMDVKGKEIKFYQTKGGVLEIEVDGVKKLLNVNGHLQ